MKKLILIALMAMPAVARADFRCLELRVTMQADTVTITGSVDNLPITMPKSEFERSTVIDLGYDGGGYREHLKKNSSQQWELQVDYDGRSTGIFGCG